MHRDKFSRVFEEDGESWNIDFCDTLPDQYTINSIFPGTDLFCICFSVGDYKSFHDVKEQWIETVQKYFTEKTRILLIGMQTDLRNDPDTLETLAKQGLEPLTFEDGYKLFQDLDRAIGYLECSAQNGEHTGKIFEEIINYFSYLKHHENDLDCAEYTIACTDSTPKAKSARK